METKGQGRAIERVESLHEAIDRSFDRLERRRPEVDEEALALIGRRLAALLRAYIDVYDAAGAWRRFRLNPLRQRPSEWLETLRELRNDPKGDERWWTRMNDLVHRMRAHFGEVESEILEAAFRPNPCNDSNGRTAS